MQRLLERLKGRTLLVVAHRLERLAALETLAVFEDGRVVQRGAYAPAGRPGRPLPPPAAGLCRGRGRSEAIKKGKKGARGDWIFAARPLLARCAPGHSSPCSRLSA